MRQVQALSLIIKRFCKLPEGIEFYEVDGQILFPLKVVDETSNDSIIYLIKRGDPITGKGFFKYGILLSELLTPHTHRFLQCLEENRASSFNPDGGDLGLEG